MLGLQRYMNQSVESRQSLCCLLYTSDAADDLLCVDLGGRRIIKKKKKTKRFDHDQKRILAIYNSNQKFRLGKLGKIDKVIIERHRHRYEVNPKYIEALQKSGLIFSGYHQREDGTKLMEFIELKNHKFFLATQSHPEFKSRLEDPSPLFYGFVEAMLK